MFGALHVHISAKSQGVALFTPDAVPSDQPRGLPWMSTFAFLPAFLPSFLPASQGCSDCYSHSIALYGLMCTRCNIPDAVTALWGPKLRDCFNLCLFSQVQEQADVSAGGVLLPSSAKERPISGRVVRTGPGKLEKDGKRKAIDVQEGDQVLYFKYAGDPMETPDGSKYVVVHESDLLCKT